MKPGAKSPWSPASSEPANSLPVLNAAAPRESGHPSPDSRPVWFLLGTWSEVRQETHVVVSSQPLREMLPRRYLWAKKTPSASLTRKMRRIDWKRGASLPALEIRPPEARVRSMAEKAAQRRRGPRNVGGTRYFLRLAV